MKHAQTLISRTLIITVIMCALSAAAFADSKPAQPATAASAPSTTQKSAKPAYPDVTLPFTFQCPHCGMKITIKSVDDWNKGCYSCACGEKNIACYNDSLKKKPAK